MTTTQPSPRPATTSADKADEQINHTERTDAPAATDRADRAPLVQLLHLDPRTLLGDRNISARDADPVLIASVRDLGVLTPVSAVRTADGTVRLRTGHRRTAAAIAADLPTIPAIVAQVSGHAEDAEAAAQAVERLVEQWAENEHRAGLDAEAKVEALAQLSFLGLSTDQVAARTHVSREHAAAAITVAASTAARRALAQAPGLDLTHAAAIAEFEQDPQAAEHLTRVALMRPASFPHEVATARSALAHTQARERARTLLAERGVPVIDKPGWAEQAVALYRLRHDGQPLTAAAHATCPGRAAYLVTDWSHRDMPGGVDLSALEEEEHPKPAEPDADQPDEHVSEPAIANSGDDGDATDGDATDGDDTDEEDKGEFRASVRVWAVKWACTDPDAYGHTNPSRTATGGGASAASEGVGQVDLEQDREAQRTQRRRVRENNAAWRIAEGVRRDFLRVLLTRKSAPKGAAAVIATVTAAHPYALTHHSAAEVARDLLGTVAPQRGRHTDAARATLTKTSEARALVIALGVVLAACEATTDVGDWRSPSSTTALLLNALAGWGYTRCDVERLACGEQPQTVETDQVDQHVEPDQGDQDAP